MAHVERHPLVFDAALRPTALLTRRMVALNVLRELDDLLGHAIAEIALLAGLPAPPAKASNRAKLRVLTPHYVSDAAEGAALASFDARLRRMLAARARASDMYRLSGGDRAAGQAVGELAAAMAEAARLHGAIAEKLAALSCGSATPRAA